MNIYPLTLGGAGREDGTGRRITHIYRASDIGVPADQVHVAVMNERRIPQMGAQLRADPRLFVISRDLQAGKDPNDMLVRVEYGVPSNEGASAQVGDVTRDVRGDIITETTTTDINGVKMRTDYISGLSSGGGGFSISISTIIHEVEVQRPTYTLIWRRIEEDWVYPRVDDIAGHVNAAPWLGQAADRWLLNVRSSEQQKGRHSVEYSASFNKSGWQATVVHNENGRIPLDADKSNGIQEYQVYPRFDARKLRLPA